MWRMNRTGSSRSYSTTVHSSRLTALAPVFVQAGAVFVHLATSTRKFSLFVYGFNMEDPGYVVGKDPVTMRTRKGTGTLNRCGVLIVTLSVCVFSMESFIVERSVIIAMCI